MDPACTDGTTVLLLDTPGLDAPYRNAAWDPQIMVCVMLLLLLQFEGKEGEGCRSC